MGAEVGTAAVGMEAVGMEAVGMAEASAIITVAASGVGVSGMNVVRLCGQMGCAAIDICSVFLGPSNSPTCRRPKFLTNYPKIAMPICGSICAIIVRMNFLSNVNPALRQCVNINVVGIVNP